MQEEVCSKAVGRVVETFIFRPMPHDVFMRLGCFNVNDVIKILFVEVS